MTKLSRGVTHASAVCAALLAAGITDAKSSQTRMSAAPMPSAQAVAAAVQQRLTDRQQLSRPDLPRPPDALQPGFGDREPFVLRHCDEIDDRPERRDHEGRDRGVHRRCSSGGCARSG